MYEIKHLVLFRMILNIQYFVKLFVLLKLFVLYLCQQKETI